MIEPEPEFDVAVSARRQLADGVIELALTPLAGQVPKWAPGAHVDLLLDEPGLVRQYSLCGDPEDGGALTVAVLREPDGRGGSAWIHDRLHAGDRLRVRGPRNHFAQLAAERYLFLAGGIGITPLLPMVRAAGRAGVPWRLVYGGRSLASMAYLDELDALARDSRDGEVWIRPQDHTGLLDLDAILACPQPGTLVYCCGPEALLVAVEQRCASWPAGSLHVERFAAQELDTAAERPIQVECALSGLLVDVPAGTSILHAVEAAGVTVLSSCQEGTCGTCETVVLDGVPDHRDSVLSREEHEANEVMMICCSRARTPRLVLEL